MTIAETMTTTKSRGSDDERHVRHLIDVARES